MMDVSRETNDRLDLYAALLRKWNPRINLVAPTTLDHLEHRHFKDCLQITKLPKENGGKWVDLGSGGGLPGLIVAIQRPASTVVLVESDQRKSTFLRTVIRELALENAAVTTDRIENILPLNADHISARALAPLPQLMSYVSRHISADGTAWLMKGRKWQAEVAQAQESWRFSLTPHQSVTDSDAAILEIKGIHHV